MKLKLPARREYGDTHFYTSIIYIDQHLRASTITAMDSTVSDLMRSPWAKAKAIKMAKAAIFLYIPLLNLH